MNQKGFAPLLILLVVLAIAIVLVVVVSISPKKDLLKPKLSPSPDSLASPSARVVSRPDWKYYSDFNIGFQIQYPPTFQVKDEGPNEEFIAISKGSAVSGNTPPILDTVSFTDSNKNRFTLNIYPKSPDPSLNTNVNNLHEFSGYCGTHAAQKTLVNKIFTEAGLTYKQVVQVDPKGVNLTDYCIFAPEGNLMVLRNNTGATVIAMKQMLTTILYSNQKDQDGKTLYMDKNNKFALRFPTDFKMSSASADFIPPYGLENLLVNFRKEGYKNEKSQFSQVANVSVSMSTDVLNCLKDFPGNTSINGTDYKTRSDGGGATGHSIGFTSYRTLHSACYEVQTSIQTSTGSGDGLSDAEDAVTQDKTALQKDMSAILKSLNFSN